MNQPEDLEVSPPLTDVELSARFQALSQKLEHIPWEAQIPRGLAPNIDIHAAIRRDIKYALDPCFRIVRVGAKRFPAKRILWRLSIWSVGIAVAIVAVGPILSAFLAHSLAIYLQEFGTKPANFIEHVQNAKAGNPYSDLRNIGLVLLGLIGMPLALWRSVIAFQQHHLSERGFIIDRYQKGAQMLESNELSVRIAGVYALRELASSDPDETYFLVLDMLFSFVRENSKIRTKVFTDQNEAEEQLTIEEFPSDLQSALDAACFLRNKISGQKLEKKRTDWRANLRKSNLSRAKLIGANLTRADLFGANLSNAELEGANLTDADLGNSILSGALLSGSILTGANLWDAVLFGAHLSGATLSGAELWGSKLSGAILSGSNLSGAKLTGLDLSKIDLNHANLSDADLATVNLSKANLTGANLSRARIGSSDLSEAYLEDAILSGAMLIGSNLSKAALLRVDLSRAKLKSADLSCANLSGADLSCADFSDVELKGTIFSDFDLAWVDLSAINLSSSDFVAPAYILKVEKFRPWAYVNSPPKHMPLQFSERVCYRKRKEYWNHFIERMMRERPLSGWTEKDKL